jgi:hypothetical protein
MPHRSSSTYCVLDPIARLLRPQPQPACRSERERTYAMNALTWRSGGGYRLRWYDHEQRFARFLQVSRYGVFPRMESSSSVVARFLKGPAVMATARMSQIGTVGVRISAPTGSRKPRDEGRSCSVPGGASADDTATGRLAAAVRLAACRNASHPGAREGPNPVHRTRSSGDPNPGFPAYGSH